MKKAHRTGSDAPRNESPSSWLERFWSEPVRAEPLALFRMLSALMLLYQLIVGSTAESGLDTSTLDAACRIVWGVALLALFLGWRTRVFACVGLACALTLESVNGLFGAMVEIPVQLSFYLALAPVGTTWSLDSLRQARRLYVDPTQVFESAILEPRTSPAFIAPWSLRILQLYLVGNYLLFAMTVTQGAGESWFSGEVLFGALQNPFLARFSPSDLPISLGICEAVSMVAVVWAVSMPALAFQRRTIPWMLGLGGGLHIFVGLLFTTGWTGHLLLAFYPLFVSGKAVVGATVRLVQSKVDTPYTVAYDTFCPLCRRSRLMLERMDLGHRLRFVDIHDRETMAREFPPVSYGQCLEELQVKKPDGSITGGYFAFRTLTRVLPALRLIRWVFFVPGVPLVGAWIYRWIAKHRYRLVDCSSEVCNLHVRALSQANIDEDEIAVIVERARNAARMDSV